MAQPSIAMVDMGTKIYSIYGYCSQPVAAPMSHESNVNTPLNGCSYPR